VDYTSRGSAEIEKIYSNQKYLGETHHLVLSPEPPKGAIVASQFFPSRADAPKECYAKTASAFYPFRKASRGKPSLWGLCSAIAPCSATLHTAQEREEEKREGRKGQPGSAARAAKMIGVIALVRFGCGWLLVVGRSDQLLGLLPFGAAGRIVSSAVSLLAQLVGSVSYCSCRVPSGFRAAVRSVPLASSFPFLSTLLL
jgi:hypothetical protein